MDNLSGSVGTSGYLTCSLAVWCHRRKTSPIILESVLLLMRKIDVGWRIGYVRNFCHMKLKQSLAYLWVSTAKRTGWYGLKRRMVITPLNQHTDFYSRQQRQRFLALQTQRLRSLFGRSFGHWMCQTKFVISCGVRPMTPFQQKRTCRRGISFKTQPVNVVEVELKMESMQYGAAKWSNKFGGNWKSAENSWTKILLVSMTCCKESSPRKFQTWLSYLPLSGGVSSMNET